MAISINSPRYADQRLSSPAAVSNSLAQDSAGESSNSRSNPRYPLPPVSAAELACWLADWAPRTDVALYQQLADRLSTLMDRGELRRGVLLPSERALARSLAVSRRTVTAAYDQLRAAERVSSATGVGTWCTGSHARRRKCRSAKVETHVQHLLMQSPGVCDLAIASPPSHPMVTMAREAVRQTLGAMRQHSHGYAPAGIQELREQVSVWFAKRGVPTDPQQIVITSGAAQALWLATGLLRPQSEVLVETPTSPIVLSILRNHDLRLRGIPADQRGIAIEQAEGDPPTAVLVSPSYLNPTGAHLSADRCRRLAEYARDRGVLVVEDLVLSDIQLEGTAPRSVAALVPNAPVLSVGSVSKLFWSGLRIGWVRGPKDLISQIAQEKGITDIGTSTDLQLQAAWLLRHHSAATEARLPALRAQRDALAECLSSLLPNWRWERPEGGLSLWVELPHGGVGQLVQQARRERIALMPGSAFDLNSCDDRHLRLPFVQPYDAYPDIIARLAACYRRMRPSDEEHAVLAS